jgi:DNA-binding NarL/FixJ family response regulator
MNAQATVVISTDSPLSPEHLAAIESEGFEVATIETRDEAPDERVLRLVATIEKLSEAADLDDTQARIFEGVAFDKSNGQIGKRVGLSADQVSYAVSVIVEKLNAAMPEGTEAPRYGGRDALVWHACAFYLRK